MRGSSLLLLLLLVPTGCARHRVPDGPPVAETLLVPTADGWTIALHRFPPARGAPQRHTPVILCHGITANLRNWDLHERLSLPRQLARTGFDTYVLELRGSGASFKPRLFDQQAYDYTFDDYALKDVPAAVEAVAQRSRSGQVHWIGHSLGGIVMYAYLQRVGGARIRSVAAVGSPPSITDHSSVVRNAGELFPIVDFFFDELPAGTLTTLLAPLAYPARTSVQHVLANFDDLDPEVARTGAAVATDNVAASVVAQLLASEDGHFRSADGAHDYTAGMADIEVPIFFLVGQLDHLAPPALFREVYPRVKAPEKRIEVLSVANGYHHDYGHLDLVIGESAPAEVYPLLVDWVVGHE